MEAGEHPYAWVTSIGLPKDLATAVIRGSDDYQPIRRTLTKLAQATGKSVEWWLTGEEGLGPAAAPQKPLAPVVGTIAAGTGEVDVRKLELAIQALDVWEETRNLKVASERRPAVIAVLYQFLVKSDQQGPEAVDVVLRALG